MIKTNKKEMKQKLVLKVSFFIAMMGLVAGLIGAWSGVGAFLVFFNGGREALWSSLFWGNFIAAIVGVLLSPIVDTTEYVTEKFKELDKKTKGGDKKWKVKKSI